MEEILLLESRKQGGTENQNENGLLDMVSTEQTFLAQQSQNC